MKLDPRIKQGCKPFTMFDTDDAKKFIGKKGLFHDNLEIFHDLNYNGWDIKFGILEKVSDYHDAPYYINQRDGFKYFLPLEYTDTDGIDILKIGLE